MVPCLDQITSNNFSVKDSFAFANEIRNLRNGDETNQFVMASFDIKSLFTNIPLNETIHIAANELYDIKNTPFLSFSKNQFLQLLKLAVTEIYFMFNQRLYLQTDGCAMGSPLGCSLANVFLCHHEAKWLDNCPQNFKPLLYRRYVDDTFMLFRERSHIPLFLNYLNQQHPNIKFTHEIESNDKLNFLDVTVEKYDNNFKTAVYRKAVFSGLGMNFSSFVAKSYKRNLITCLVTRAFKICSHSTTFDIELEFLKDFFLKNGFPINFINKMFRCTLEKIYKPFQQLTTVPRKQIFYSTIWLEFPSEILKRKLSQIIRKYYPQLELKFVFKNSNTIGNFFKFKDVLPASLSSSVIYKYSCRECSASYIGMTSKQLKIRISQHMGRSFRTGNINSNEINNSKIFEHFEQKDHPISVEDFKILTSCPNEDLFILESIYIHKLNPTLNERNSSFDLCILK